MCARVDRLSLRDLRDKFESLKEKEPPRKPPLSVTPGSSPAPVRKVSLPDFPRTPTSFRDVAALWKEKEEEHSPSLMRRSTSPLSPRLLSSSSSLIKRDNPADRKEAVAAECSTLSSSSSSGSPVAITRQQRTASVDYAKKREADALLPWTHKADTREVFEQRTPQQWKQEKVALEKRVLSPRLELNNSSNSNGTCTTTRSGDGGTISSHRRVSQEQREAEEDEEERDGRRDSAALERERTEMADERRRMDEEWRELGAAKLRFSNEQSQAKRRLLDEWARVNEEKQKLAARYRELGEMLSRHNSSASATAGKSKAKLDDGLTAKRPS